MQNPGRLLHGCSCTLEHTHTQRKDKEIMKYKSTERRIGAGE